VRELLDRRRTAGALPLHQDDLFTLHATLFVLQRTLKWNDGIRVRDMADASMVIAEIRNRLLALAPRSESVRRRPEGRHASWPQPKLEPGDPVEVDLVVGIDPLVVREFHADTDEADVPWIPAMDSMASESDGDTDLTYEPAPSFPPRRDGLTTLLQLLPGKAYEILVPLPRNVAVDTRYAVRLSDELLRCGIILESAMPDGFGRGTGEGAPSAWRVIVRSRRKSTVVSVSAGAILANVGVIYDPADD
jgi:hypothetical protein